MFNEPVAILSTDNAYTETFERQHLYGTWKTQSNNNECLQKSRRTEDVTFTKWFRSMCIRQ